MTTLDTLLLLALPASGKSEIRRYLGSLDPAAAAGLHLGPLADLDDYPYVHLMRRISEELAAIDAAPIFFGDADLPLLDPHDWLTLIELLNGDYRTATGPTAPATGTATATATAAATAAASDFIDRLIDARTLAGAGDGLRNLSAATRRSLESAITADVAATAPIERRAAGGTIVIEFARGGPEDTSLPLGHPLGYAHSLACLDPAILEAAAILYVSVDPADSRRRNRERHVPGREGDASILHHGVPEEVMRLDYGTDDMEWLLAHSPVPGTVTVQHRSGGVFHVPTAVFDNREDRTSFLRADPQEWPTPAVESLHRWLTVALADLADRTATR